MAHTENHYPTGWLQSQLLASPIHSVVARSVADGIHEWERKHRSAFFVRDDKRAPVQLKSVTNALAHALASECRRLIPYRSQIVKLDTYPVEDLRGIVFDVEKVTWHRGPPVFRTVFSNARLGRRVRGIPRNGDSRQ